MGDPSKSLVITFFNLMTLFCFKYYTFTYAPLLTVDTWVPDWPLHYTLHTWHSRHHRGSTPQTSWCMRSHVPKVCGSILLQPSHLWPRVCTLGEPCIYIVTGTPTGDQSHRLTPDLPSVPISWPNCAGTTIFGAYETRHFWKMHDSNSWRTATR